MNINKGALPVFFWNYFITAYAAAIKYIRAYNRRNSNLISIFKVRAHTQCICRSNNAESATWRFGTESWPKPHVIVNLSVSIKQPDKKKQQLVVSGWVCGCKKSRNLSERQTQQPVSSARLRRGTFVSTAPLTFSLPPPLTVEIPPSAPVCLSVPVLLPYF